MTIVLAVSDAAPPQAGGPVANILLGDYEMIAVLGNVSQDGVLEALNFEGTDETSVERSINVTRFVPADEIAGGRLQIFGFHTKDPLTIPGATSLGPSRLVVNELRERGRVPYTFKLFETQATIIGTLVRRASVRFPVLIDGQRVELPAIHARGEFAQGERRAQFETYVLDHPVYPLSLRIAYGPLRQDGEFVASFAREIVRIDYPIGVAFAGGPGGVAGAGSRSLGDALDRDCRVEVPGVYFDFNRATLKSQSRPALEQIAAVLRSKPTLAVRIEGHTDAIGSDEYNDELSTRRAAAVRDVLMGDLGVEAGRLEARGYGERKPIETNETLAGRARNRRVELACAGTG